MVLNSLSVGQAPGYGSTTTLTPDLPWRGLVGALAEAVLRSPVADALAGVGLGSRVGVVGFP
jgi:hypothetical protein